jgi:hypothetical protein
MLITGVNDTGDKLFSGVNDTGEKFIAGVVVSVAKLQSLGVKCTKLSS